MNGFVVHIQFSPTEKDGGVLGSELRAQRALESLTRLVREKMRMDGNRARGGVGCRKDGAPFYNKQVIQVTIANGAPERLRADIEALYQQYQPCLVTHDFEVLQPILATAATA